MPILIHSYGYGPRYQYKTVTYQDVDQQVVRDTIYQTKAVVDSQVQTRMVYDTNIETSQTYVTQQVSRTNVRKYISIF